MTIKTIDQKNERIHRVLEMVQKNLTRSNQLHQEFLNHQALNLQTLAADAGSSTPIGFSSPSKQVVININQLKEFGTGSIAKCFGSEYEILDHRKSPRIPNGDLLMIDRVLAISGERGNLRPPASTTTEFDIPENIWFINENQYSGIPLGVLMEIALQPCGILSAYLGTSLILPENVNLFRNLDGEISFIANPNLAGKTITNRSTLINSVSGGGMLIQKYAFELSIGESVFLKGNSSFGYFTQVVMERQTGIDTSGNDFMVFDDYQSIELDEYLPTRNNSSINHLGLIDRIAFNENGGRHGCGIIIGEKKLSGSEWFYTNHFYQDPVMPGSLGIEAIVQGMWAFAKSSHDKKYFQDPIADFSHSESFSWKYRGQVTPANGKVNFDIHLKDNHASDSSINLLADADFWVDGVKIYTVQNISLTISKGK
ncbi:MAG: hypothetical protein Q7J07_03750 [Pelolinea sp.]|nr:hypothetical protein [Pelolinea sp.]